MNNIVTRTLKAMGHACGSILPDEETAHRIGTQFVDRYGFKVNAKHAR